MEDQTAKLILEAIADFRQEINLRFEKLETVQEFQKADFIQIKSQLLELKLQVQQSEKAVIAAMTVADQNTDSNMLLLTRIDELEKRLEALENR